MTGRTDAILFDVDDTLCTYRRSSDEVLVIAFDRVGVDPLFTVDEYYRRYEDSLGTSTEIDDLRARCFADLAAANGHDPDLGRAVAAAYADERDQTAVDELPGARRTVLALAEEYRLGVVTNGPRSMQEAKLAAIGLDDAFDVVVCAGYDALAKPSAEPFHHVLDALGVESAAGVHVGNSLRCDVAGAHAAGVRAAWLRQSDEAASVPDPGPTYTLEELADLLRPPWGRV